MTFASDQNEQDFQTRDNDSSENSLTDGEAIMPPESEDAVQEDLDTSPNIEFEDLTLAQVIGQAFHAPRNTFQSFRRIVATSDESVIDSTATTSTPKPSRSLLPKNWSEPSKPLSNEERIARQRDALLLGVRLVAFLIAIYGNWIMATDRSEETGLAGGLPFLLAAFAIWIAGEIFSAWPIHLQRTVSRVEEIDVLPNAPLFPVNRETDFWPLALRFMGAALALTMSIITLSGTANNRFTTLGVVMWIASTIMWVIVFAPSEWSIVALINAVRRVQMPRGWTLALLIGIMIIAALFRFTHLNGIPAEMTSDHVEKILDSQRILDGNPQVFFPNNGGREPIQFYLMAIISQIPGLGMNFFTLKWLTAVEGMICIPVLWWMGREIIGEDEPQLGNAVGLLLGVLVAVSYWHTMLSRLGLRIVLTVIVTGLLMIYLSRAMRRNQRGDFIKAGLVLGSGVYAYQAARMLPVVVVAGIVLAIIFSLFQSRRREQIVRYITNLIILVIITFAVFVPMAGFARDYPEDFWRRTSGRLLGDDTIQVTDANGQIVTREVTFDERMTAFHQNLGILVNNIRNALLMYNWKGDVAWVTAVPNRPEMDIMTGALLIVGLGAWAVRMVKRRDVVDWLMPAALFIMLLPSALSIAYPIENPSATRTSGSLPEAYLFAAVPLALMWFAVQRLLPNRWGKIVGGAGIGVVILLAASANWNTYFVDFNESYINSSPAPYTEAGRFLRGFADSGGSFGNAFMIAYPYWWDHRAVGIEAGALDYPNGIVSRDQVPQFIKDTAERHDKYQLDPDKDLLFFYNPIDTDTEADLMKWFPNGTKQLIHSYKPGDDFEVYRVPKLGMNGLLVFEIQTGVGTSQ